MSLLLTPDQWELTRVALSEKRHSNAKAGWPVGDIDALLDKVEAFLETEIDEPVSDASDIQPKHRGIISARTGQLMKHNNSKGIGKHRRDVWYGYNAPDVPSHSKCEHQFGPVCPRHESGVYAQHHMGARHREGQFA